MEEVGTDEGRIVLVWELVGKHTRDGERRVERGLSGQNLTKNYPHGGGPVRSCPDSPLSPVSP